jgi:hypothetical protein
MEFSRVAADLPAWARQNGRVVAIRHSAHHSARSLQLSSPCPNEQSLVEDALTPESPPAPSNGASSRSYKKLGACSTTLGITASILMTTTKIRPDARARDNNAVA